jgi:hypothetical protein
MRLLKRKTQLDRVLETVSHSLDPSALKDVRLPGPGTALKTGAIAVGGFAALTAASAGISSIRRRSEGGGRGS